MPNSSPHIITVILNSNQRDETLACVQSLQDSSYKNHKTIVQDNASTDGSVEALRTQFPAVQIITSSDNRCGAGNSRTGIMVAMDQNADWLFLLKAGTVLAADCLERMVTTGERNNSTGIVGPMVYHFEEPELIKSAGVVLGNEWNSIHRRQNEFDGRRSNRQVVVDCIAGCAILIRWEVVEQIRMLDERFSSDRLEQEMCRQAQKYGWRVIVVPQAKLWHKGV